MLRVDYPDASVGLQYSYVWILLSLLHHLARELNHVVEQGYL